MSTLTRLSAATFAGTNVAATTQMEARELGKRVIAPHESFLAMLQAAQACTENH